MKTSLLKRISLVLVVSLLCTMAAGCGEKAPQVAAPEKTAVQTEADSVSLYIGTRAQGFQEYPVQLEGELSPDSLIAAISELTGWNLTLCDPVTTGKGGMTVNFSSDSFLTVGPPEPQKEEFHVFDVISLTVMVLDSIQETLRRNYVLSPGDPDSLDIYFSMEDESISADGILIPMEEPWDSREFLKPLS